MFFSAFVKYLCYFIYWNKQVKLLIRVTYNMASGGSTSLTSKVRILLLVTGERKNGDKSPVVLVDEQTPNSNVIFIAHGCN